MQNVDLLRQEASLTVLWGLLEDQRPDEVPIRGWHVTVQPYKLHDKLMQHYSFYIPKGIEVYVSMQN